MNNIIVSTRTMMMSMCMCRMGMRNAFALSEALSKQNENC